MVARHQPSYRDILVRDLSFPSVLHLAGGGPVKFAFLVDQGQYFGRGTSRDPDRALSCDRETSDPRWRDAWGQVGPAARVASDDERSHRGSTVVAAYEP